MPEQWFIRVGEKDYGPADLETLREWKREGRVLATNPARRADSDSWTTAADIPDLFIPPRPPVQLPPADSVAESASQVEDRPARSPVAAQERRRSFASILGETLSIYRTGFFQFLGLTLLTLLPSLCGRFAEAFIRTSPTADVDLRTLAAAGFGFCMFVLSAALVPIYIAGIQIVSNQVATGERPRFFAALNHAVRYWPRVTGLCLFVYGIFTLLMIFAACIPVIVLMMPQSMLAAGIAVALLFIQVWLFGRFFVNVLFWQQFAVLENADFVESLRLSKELARSGGELPWYRRPKWRGVFIASLWFAFVLAIALAQEWPVLRDYFNQLLATTPDPQLLLQKLTAAQKARGFNLLHFELSILQRVLQPLLGIAFVVLYRDSRSLLE